MRKNENWKFELEVLDLDSLSGRTIEERIVTAHLLKLLFIGCQAKGLSYPSFINGDYEKFISYVELGALSEINELMPNKFNVMEITPKSSFKNLLLLSFSIAVFEKGIEGQEQFDKVMGFIADFFPAGKWLEYVQKIAKSKSTSKKIGEVKGVHALLLNEYFKEAVKKDLDKLY